MRKSLSVILAVIMLFSVLPLTAFAAEDDNDNNTFLYDSLLDDDSYYHLEYVENEDYFESDIRAYTIMGLYDDAWANYFTGCVDVDYATTVLVALIEKVEAEYNNETYEEILKYLKGASSVADLINRVNEYTDLLEFAETNEWATSISILNSAISVLEYGNELYEKYVEGYALILSVQASNIYYTDLLQRLVDNSKNEDVTEAAGKLLVTINETQEEAVNDLLKEMAKDTAYDAAMLGLNFAIDSYSVTAAIKKVYNFSTSVADKLFNTSEKYEYISSLVSIYYIEDVMTDWFSDALSSDIPEYKDFAVSSMITIRQTGEDLLANYGVASNTEIAELFNKYDGRDIVARTALSSLKLSVIKDLLTAEVPYDVASSVAVMGSSALNVKANNTSVIAIGNNPFYTITNDGAFICKYNEDLGEYLKAVFLFGDKDYFVNLSNPDDIESYVIFDSDASGVFDTYYTCIALASDRTASLNNTANWFLYGNDSPVYSISKDGEKYLGNMLTTFDVEPTALSDLTEINYTPVAPVDTDDIIDTVDEDTASFFAEFAQSFRDFFTRIFSVFKIAA